jgi:hypothetical protein
LVKKNEEEYWKRYGSQRDEIPSEVHKPATGNAIFLFIGMLNINLTSAILIFVLRPESVPIELLIIF